MSDASEIAGELEARVGQLQLQRLQLQAAQQYQPEVDALLRTGPTGTNVNDFRAILVL